MNIYNSLGIDWSHLCPINKWIPVVSGPSYIDAPDTSQYIMDQTTNDVYFNQPKKMGRFICLLAGTGGIVLQAAALVVGIVYRIFRVVSFYDFWKKEGPHFTGWATDAIRILISPLAIPSLFLTAMYGVINPRDGKKLHSRMEILFHGHPVVVTCMHSQGRVSRQTLIRPIQNVRESTLCKSQEMIVNDFLRPIVVVIQIIKVLSFYSLWRKSDKNNRCIQWLKDGLDIVGMSFGIPLCLLTSIFTLIHPKKGVELHDKVLQLFYHKSPTSAESQAHFFGGDANQSMAL